jgi:hypothetical protein
MAKNLRAKIPEGDTLTIFDVNAASLEQFTQEATPAGVVVAKTPREVAEKAVSSTCLGTVLLLDLCVQSPSMMSQFVLSMNLSWGLLSEVLAMISLLLQPIL